MKLPGFGRVKARKFAAVLLFQQQYRRLFALLLLLSILPNTQAREMPTSNRSQEAIARVTPHVKTELSK